MYLACSALPKVSNEKKFPSGKIIYPLLTKFFQSRWLDIGLVHFLRTYGPRLHLGPQTRKKNLANIQPSWLHACLLRTTSCVQQEKCPNINNPLLTKLGWSKMTGYWRHLLFACLWTLTTSPTLTLGQYITHTCTLHVHVLLHLILLA